MRWVNEILLVPHFILRRLVSHFVIMNYNYRGIGPEVFREKWGNWLRAEQDCCQKMDALPVLGRATPMMNALMGALIGISIMLWFNVFLPIILIYLVCCFFCGYLYFVKFKIKINDIVKTFLEFPIYILRLLVVFTATQAFAIVDVLVRISILTLFVAFLRVFLHDTFLFYHWTLPGITLSFVLGFDIVRKILYFTEIMYHKEVYFENMRSMRKGEQNITRSVFYKDIVYSLFEGTTVTLFENTVRYAFAVFFITHLIAIDISTPIGLLVMILAVPLNLCSFGSEFHQFTRHKLMHTEPYYNIFHIEHHLPRCPTALIGFSEAAILEGATSQYLLFGSQAGISVLCYSIVMMGNEFSHNYHTVEPMVSMRRTVNRMIEFVPKIFGMVKNKLLRSKTQLGNIPIFANPDIHPVYKESEEGNEIEMVEEEMHGQHHWRNAPYYAYGITDYYIGLELNSFKQANS